MRRTWLYLKLAVLLLGAVMMFGNLQTNRVSAEEGLACTGACSDECWLTVCCKCNTDSACGCHIEPGEKGCGDCEKSGVALE